MMCMEGALPGPLPLTFPLSSPYCDIWSEPWLCTSTCSTYLTSDPRSVSSRQYLLSWYFRHRSQIDSLTCFSSGQTSYWATPPLEVDASGSTSWQKEKVPWHNWYRKHVGSIIPRPLLWRQTSILENLHGPKDKDSGSWPSEKECDL